MSIDSAGNDGSQTANGADGEGLIPLNAIRSHESHPQVTIPVTGAANWERGSSGLDL